MFPLKKPLILSKTVTTNNHSAVADLAERGREVEDKQVKRQPERVRIGNCVVDLESNTCITHNRKVSSSEICEKYYGSHWTTEWDDKYSKALRLRRLGKKEYRKRYTIPYLGANWVLLRWYAGESRYSSGQ